MVEIAQQHDGISHSTGEKALAWLRESHIDALTAAGAETASALGFVPIATAKAGRASSAACQRVSSAKGGRSIGKSRQRFTIGASAMSAMVRRSSAKQAAPGDVAVENLELRNEIGTLRGKIAAHARRAASWRP